MLSEIYLKGLVSQIYADFSERYLYTLINIYRYIHIDIDIDM